MNQQLEKVLYKSTPKEKAIEGSRVLRARDLERMSATVLYTDHLPKCGAGGFVPSGKDAYDAILEQNTINDAKITGMQGGKLTVVDLPGVGVQMHMHEGSGAQRIYNPMISNK